MRQNKEIETIGRSEERPSQATGYERFILKRSWSRGIFPAAFARSMAAPNPSKGMFQMTANVAETGVAGQELTQFVERVERLEEEKKPFPAIFAKSTQK